MSRVSTLEALRQIPNVSRNLLPEYHPLQLKPCLESRCNIRLQHQQCALLTCPVGDIYAQSLDMAQSLGTMCVHKRVHMMTDS